MAIFLFFNIFVVQITTGPTFIETDCKNSLSRDFLMIFTFAETIRARLTAGENVTTETTTSNRLPVTLLLLRATP